VTLLIANTIVLRKLRDFWFPLISVEPDAAEFFLVKSAVFRRLPF
jgi:hypothetical protein